MRNNCLQMLMGGVNSNFFISDFIRLAIGGNKRRTASRKSHRSITEKKRTWDNCHESIMKGGER